jgi:AraC-like DNA-binding protein
MRGETSSYAVDPVGETVVGIVTSGVMEARRGGERFLFGPGEVCVWDSSAPHTGRPGRGQSWQAALIVLEPPTLGEMLRIERGATFQARGGPRIRERSLAARFAHVHELLEHPLSAFAGEVLLQEWLVDVGGGELEAVPSGRVARRERGLQAACELLAHEPARNVTLAELSAVAGMSRHRLRRLFLAAFGVPPHRFQLGQRIRLARALLEQGRSAAETAQLAGFVDQPHLHRHFRRTLGITPARYQLLVRADVQDTNPAAV